MCVCAFGPQKWKGREGMMVGAGKSHYQRPHRPLTPLNLIWLPGGSEARAWPRYPSPAVWPKGSSPILGDRLCSQRSPASMWRSFRW